MPDVFYGELNDLYNRIMIRKKPIIATGIFIFLLFGNYSGFTQSEPLTLTQCYELVRQNYPLIKSRELVKQTGEYSIENAKTAWLPNISLNAQYTNQSDVTSVPLKIPGQVIPQIDKNQYKVYAEASQVVYDGGAISNQKKTLEAQTKIEEESIEVELYKLNERINQIYFGILLLNGQLKQSAILKSDIQTGLTKTEAAFANGIVLKSNVDAIKAELLKTDQRITELQSARTAYLNMLGTFINQSLNDQTELEMPPSINISAEIKRPELLLYDARLMSTAIQSRSITSRNLPRLSLFFQGGYGLPALNMLNPDADTYYIAGVRFAYPLTGFYNLNRDKSINKLARENIEVQKEIFLFNTHLQITQQSAELVKTEQLIKYDDEIVELRESIKQASLAQLENGVITSADYLREVNAADNARQMKLIHEIQLLLTQYNHQILTGK